MIHLDIYSDPVCPWCYLGKANLDRALTDHPSAFTVAWHPFQLNPTMPPEGVDKTEYLLKRMGGPDRLTQVHQHFRDTAAKAGVAMDPDKPKRIPNTGDAHRLIHWAGIEGRQDAMVQTLFNAYWVDGLDIGDPAILTDLAGKAGLDPSAIARLLTSDADRDVVATREAQARERGVTAVPTFVIADHCVLSGAQPPEMWARVIAELAQASV